MDDLTRALCEAREAAVAMGDLATAEKNAKLMAAAVRSMRATVSIHEALAASGKSSARSPWWIRIGRWLWLTRCR